MMPQGGGGRLGPMGMMLTPWAKRLMIATAVVSILGAIGLRWLELPLDQVLVLRPLEVLGRGRVGFPAVWQLVGWPFFVPSPISLIFAVLMYGWFAGTMEAWWGSRRFLRFFLIVTAVVGLGTVLLALVWPSLAATPVAGAWPVLAGLVVAWGLTFPNQEIRLFFVLPVLGIHIVWISAGFLVLNVIFSGRLAPSIPPLLGMATAAALVTGLWRRPAKVGLHLRKWWLEQQLRQEQARRKRRVDQADHLRVVDEDDRDGPRPTQGDGTRGGGWLN